MKPMKPFKRTLLQTAAFSAAFFCSAAFEPRECCVLAGVAFAFNFLLSYAIYYAERTS